MPPRVQQPVYTTSGTLVLSPGESLGREDGSCDEFNYCFMQSRVNPQPLEYYYKDMSGLTGARTQQIGGNLIIIVG